jgi:carbamate kinase
MRKLAVVAFGGNALLKAGQKGTVNEQELNAYKASQNLVKLLNRGYNLVLTHGNGPQVGNILMANTAGNKLYGIPDMPLDISVAYSQGFIAYMLEQQLRNVLMENDMDPDVISIITQVLVNKDDPAFLNPTKPVGPYFTKEEAHKFMSETNSVFKEDKARGGWRKVVASPIPLAIFNMRSIEKLANEGHIAIAVGGGGIPCYYKKENILEGIDAVIDKDLASSLLASQIHAHKLFILTDVPKVCLNFNTPQEKTIDKMNIAEAKQYIQDGQFGAGSMGPKIQAAINFVIRSGKDAIITVPELLGIDNGGTRVTIV